MARLDEPKLVFGEAGKAAFIIMTKGYLYLLISNKDKRTYLGSTIDLKNRLLEHNNGQCLATKNRRPLTLIYSEEFETIDEARKRERYLKTAAGRRELKKLF